MRLKKGICVELTYFSKDANSERISSVTVPLWLTRKQFDALMLKAITEEQLRELHGLAPENASGV